MSPDEEEGPLAEPIPQWFCRHCGHEGWPEQAIAPRPSRRKVMICPSCLEEA